MDSILSDIIVFSRCYIEHLHGANLTLQMSKCKIGTHSCEFLGHTVGVGLISPQQAKVGAMVSFHRPITKKDVRNSLGKLL